MKITDWYCGKDHHELLQNVITKYCHVQDSESKLRGQQVPVKYQCPPQ